jgi:hypothetical protein
MNTHKNARLTPKVERMPGDTPQHPTFCARRNSGGEKRSGRAIDRAIAPPVPCEVKHLPRAI